MGSTFEDIEEGRRLQTQSLPIRYPENKQKRTKTEVIEAVVRDMNLDLAEPIKRGATKEIVTACAKRGTKTTAGMVGYVVNKMRKELSGESGSKKKNPRKLNAVPLSSRMVRTGAKFSRKPWQDLFEKLGRAVRRAAGGERRAAAEAGADSGGDPMIDQSYEAAKQVYFFAGLVIGGMLGMVLTATLLIVVGPALRRASEGNEWPDEVGYESARPNDLEPQS